MHGWRAMDVTVHSAPIYQGHSVLFLCYEFCLQAILLILIDIHGSVANWSLGHIFVTSIQISLIIFFVLFFCFRLSQMYSLNLSLKSTQGLYIFESLK